jgi:hypothetical protein
VVTHDTNTRVSSRIGRCERAVRSAVAVSMVAMIGAGMLANSPARAQESGLLTPSTVTPANVVFYAEVSLDADNTQLQAFDDILTRLGAEDSLVEAIEESATDSSSDLDLNGAEIAIGILPSALAAGADASGDLIESATSGGVTDDLEEVGSTAGDEGVVVVIRPKDIAEAEASAKESAGIDAESEDYLGIEIVSPVDSDDSIGTYAVVDDFLISGSNVDDIKAFIDVSQDDGDSLADFDEFQSTSDLLPAERVGFAFANGPALLEAASDSLDDPSMAAALADSVSAYSGYTGLVIAADEPGVRLEVVVVPGEDASEAVASGVAADLDMANRVPSDTVVFASGFDLGQSAILNGLGLALVSIFSGLTSSSSFDDSDATPEPMSIDEMYDSLASSFGFNLKTGFIDQLVGPYGFAVWGIDSEDVADVNVALVSGVADETVLGDTLGTISLLVQAGGQGQINVTSRALEGGSVNHIEISEGGTETSVDYGVVGGEFVLGVGDGAETVINGPSESLADSTMYTTALSYLPEEFQAIYYLDIAQLEAAEQGMGDAGFSQDDLIIDIIGTPGAGSQAQSFAAVTYVQDGSYFTSGILVVP